MFGCMCAQGPSDYASSDPIWSAYREASFGHGLLDVSSATSATWSWLRNQDATPTKADQVGLSEMRSTLDRPRS